MSQSHDDAAVIEEAALIARVSAGDREAFRELYNRYHRPLFSLCVRMLNDIGAAEEALQDVFLKMWRNAARFDSQKSRPFTWATTLTRRTCIDRLRAQNAAPTISDTAGILETVEFATPDPTRSAAEHQDDAARVHDALLAMPESQRAALELALFSGLTHPEIAEQIHQPVGTVKTWIRRGLLQLRTFLSHTAP